MKQTTKLAALMASVALVAAAGCASMDGAGMDRAGMGGMGPVTPPQTSVSGPSPTAPPPAAIVAAASSRTPAPPAADADMQAVLNALMALNAVPIGTVSPAEQRRSPTPKDAVMRVMQQQGRTPPPPAVTTRNLTYPGAAGPVQARVYTPRNPTGPLPVILYFHGGGWVIANLDVYKATPQALAEKANAIVVSATYRQAPENKFPAAHDDANAAYRWVLQNAQSWGGDPRRIAVAGESAGGNLAANVSISARDAGLPLPVHQLLVYPVAGSDMNTPSYRRMAAAMPLSKAGLMWFFHYVPSSPTVGQDPRVNLVAANLRGLPPTTIVSAQIDPLESEGGQLEQRLRAAGVPVDRRVFEGATHEFFSMAAVVRDAYDAQAYAVDRMRASFTAAPTR